MGLELGAWSAPATPYTGGTVPAMRLPASTAGISAIVAGSALPTFPSSVHQAQQGQRWLRALSSPLFLQHQESTRSKGSAPATSFLLLAALGCPALHRDGGSARPSPPHSQAALGPSEPPKSCCCSHRLTRLSPSAPRSQHSAPSLHPPGQRDPAGALQCHRPGRGPRAGHAGSGAAVGAATPHGKARDAPPDPRHCTDLPAPGLAAPAVNRRKCDTATGVARAPGCRSCRGSRRAGTAAFEVPGSRFPQARGQQAPLGSHPALPGARPLPDAWLCPVAPAGALAGRAEPPGPFAGQGAPPAGPTGSRLGCDAPVRDVRHRDVRHRDARPRYAQCGYGMPRSGNRMPSTNMTSTVTGCSGTEEPTPVRDARLRYTRQQYRMSRMGMSGTATGCTSTRCLAPVRPVPHRDAQMQYGMPRTSTEMSGTGKPGLNGRCGRAG